MNLTVVIPKFKLPSLPNTRMHWTALAEEKHSHKELTAYYLRRAQESYNLDLCFFNSRSRSHSPGADPGSRRRQLAGGVQGGA